MKRGILVACCALATVLGSIAVASPAAADSCPYGTVATRFPGVCTQGQAGSAPPGVVVPPNVGASPATPIVPPGGGLATVDGIPCNQNHIGTCIALEQNGGGA